MNDAINEFIDLTLEEAQMYIPLNGLEMLVDKGWIRSQLFGDTLYLSLKDVQAFAEAAKLESALTGTE